MTARRSVLYARLSVTKEESVSIDRQLASCRKYAEARGWEILGEFADDGVSATLNAPHERPGWRALMATSGFDAVVIWKVDRLARKVLDFLHVDQELQQRSAGLVAVEDPIDMTSPQGRAFAVMLAVFGEMEAAAIRARVKAARAHIVASGRWPGGGVPYGYRAVPNPCGAGRVLAMDPDRHPWLRRIVELAQQGRTINDIARHLNDESAPLPHRPRANPDRRWTRQAVDAIVRNPTIAGMTPHNPGRSKSGGRPGSPAVRCDAAGNPAVRPDLAILTVDEFADLIGRLDRSGRSKKLGERNHTSPLMSRVVICDHCNVWMCRGTNQTKPTLYCPKCRQTIGRERFDSYVVGRLLAERGDEPYGAATVADHWQFQRQDESSRRAVLLSQLASLRVARGAIGKAFDVDRVHLAWATSAQEVTS